MFLICGTNIAKRFSKIKIFRLPFFQKVLCQDYFACFDIAFRTFHPHLPAPVSTVSPIDIPSIGMEQKNDVGNIIATTEGSIALIIPISGEQYMYLKSLQDDIIKNLPQYGALNNKNYIILQ